MDLEYFRKTFHIDYKSSKPMSHQLTDYFRRMIQTGVLKEGDLMIPEVAICETLGISRSAVRLTFAKLIEEGLIVRYRGKGSFVTEHRMKRPINYLYNFTENIRSLGAEPSSFVVRAEVMDAPQFVSEQLQLSASDNQVFYLERVRSADGEPMLVEKTYIPYSLCPGIETEDFSTSSLYDVLSNRYQLHLYSAVETIESVILPEVEREQLRADQLMPGFAIRRLSKTDRGVFFEYTTSITRADRCVFQMELYNNKTAPKTPVNIQRSATL